MNIENFINVIKSDYLILVGFVAALGQISSMSRLFNSDTESWQIYAISLSLFCLMAYLSIRHFQKSKKVSLFKSKDRIYQYLGYFYILLSILSLIPASYRWAYLHTNLFQGPKAPVNIPRGHSPSSLIKQAHAGELRKSLEMVMYLDPLRNSLECRETRKNKSYQANTLNIENCIWFSLSSMRSNNIVDGGNLSKTDFKRKYENNLMNPVFSALMRISYFRKKHEPLLELGPDLIYWITHRSDYKTKFLNANILPNADEWQRLRRVYPYEEKVLRDFVIEFIGFLDPLFHIIFKNNSSETILISSINYTAKYIMTQRAEMFGAYSIPRYILKLHDGKNIDEFYPPIIVDAHSVKEIDLLITLSEPSPGALYEIILEFSSHNRRHSVKALPFFVTFFSGK
jgi:hypothetical protein